MVSHNTVDIVLVHYHTPGLYYTSATRGNTRATRHYGEVLAGNKHAQLKALIIVSCPDPIPRGAA